MNVWRSVGQSNRALLNLTSGYNPSLLARGIKRYFERNDSALEVLVFKGGKILFNRSIQIAREG